MSRKSNKTITGPERTMVMRVLRYFEQEKFNPQNILPVSNVLLRTSLATGISISSIKRIRIQEKKLRKSTGLEDGSEITIPCPARSGRRKKCEDPAFLRGLRDIVDNYVKENGKMMSLKDILALAKERLQFPGQREMLRKVLIERLGYVFEKDRRRRRKKRRWVRTRESTEESSSFEDESADEPEVNGIKTEVDIECDDNLDMTDPSMLCEVAIKEESFT